MCNVAIVEIELGNLLESRELVMKALEIQSELGDRPGILASSTTAAAILSFLGRPDTSAIALHAAISCASDLALHREPAIRLLVDSTRERIGSLVAASQIGESELRRWYEFGSSFTHDELARFTLDGLRGVDVSQPTA